MTRLRSGGAPRSAGLGECGIEAVEPLLGAGLAPQELAQRPQEGHRVLDLGQMPADGIVTSL